MTKLETKLENSKIKKCCHHVLRQRVSASVNLLLFSCLFCDVSRTQTEMNQIACRQVAFDPLDRTLTPSFVHTFGTLSTVRARASKRGGSARACLRTGQLILIRQTRAFRALFNVSYYITQMIDNPGSVPCVLSSPYVYNAHSIPLRMLCSVLDLSHSDDEYYEKHVTVELAESVCPTRLF